MSNVIWKILSQYGTIYHEKRHILKWLHGFQEKLVLEELNKHNSKMIIYSLNEGWLLAKS